MVTKPRDLLESLVKLLISDVDLIDVGSHYLLASAFVLVLNSQYTPGHDYWQQACLGYEFAVFLGHKNDTFHTGSSELDHNSFQWFEFLDAVARSIGLSPERPLVWRNLALLVDGTLHTMPKYTANTTFKHDTCNRIDDAINTYSRAYHRVLRDQACWAHLSTLREYNRGRFAHLV